MAIVLNGSQRKIILNATLGGEGWSPVLSLVADGDRRVFQVINWVGGSGVPPSTGGYIGDSGVVSSIASAVDVRGSPGLPGERSAFFLHTQSTASNTWLINHNLNLYPQIQLFTLAWVRIYADEQHLSLNTTQVSFSYPAVGYAILSL